MSRLHGGPRISQANAARERMASVLERPAEHDNAGDAAGRRVGSRHRGPRLPRDRRRRLARDQLDLPRRRAPSRGARGRDAAARGDLHRLVVERRARPRPTRWPRSGGAGATSRCSASRTPSTRPRTPSARWRCVQTDRGRVRGRAGLLDPPLPARALPVRPAVPPQRLRDALSLRAAGRSRRCRSSSASCGRSPGWRGIGAARCACWTRPTGLRRRRWPQSPADAGGYAARLDGDATRLRWACSSIPAADRRRSPATCRARSMAQGLARDARVRIARRRGRPRQRGDVLRRHRHGARRLRRRGGALGARRGPDGCAVSRCTPRTRSGRACPTGAFPWVSPRAGRAHGRGVGEADRRIRAASATRADASTCTTSRRCTTPPRRSCRGVPIVTHLHGTELKMLDAIARGAAGVGQGPHARWWAARMARGGARAPTRRS